MQTKHFIPAIAALMMMALLPTQTIYANSTSLEEETSDVRPATQKEKAVARKMAVKGAQMAKKGANMAVAAVTDPAQAEKIGEEMEKMGEEMERLGDSLDAMSQDTTFLWNEEDEDSIDEFVDNDLDDFVRGVNDGFGNFGGPWYMKLFAIFLAFMVIALLIFVGVLLFLIFTAPIWIIALIIYLIVKSRKKSSAATPTSPASPAATTASPAAASATPAAATTSAASPSSVESQPVSPADASPSAAAASPDATASAASPSAATSAQPLPSITGGTEGGSSSIDPTLSSGIKQCGLGLGIIVLVLALGADPLWGIGALVALLGLAKVFIYYLGNRKNDNGVKEAAPDEYDK